MGRRAIAVTGISLVLLVLVSFAMWRGSRGDVVLLSPAAAPAGGAVSVLLVTIDTLRADRVGAYGWTAARTPAIDALAARGARFDRAFATAPITLTSHASLLTGLYPPGHAARHNGVGASGEVVSLAAALAERGYATGAFVAAFPLDRRFGLARGFDRYSDQMPRDATGRQLNERPGSAVVTEAITWLGAQRATPFFLWVHFFEPHAPYEPDEARGAAGPSAPVDLRYGDEIARADAQVARLVSALGDRLAGTLVIVASDHGEAFGEHGEFGHSVFVYDTTLRVPLVMAGAGLPTTVVSAEVSLVDVFPTVLDLVGLPGRDVDGVSLAGVMRGAGLASRELYAESFAPLLDFGWSSLRSVRAGGRKYIAAPRPELYDVASDPSEQRDLLQDDAVGARALAARVETYSGPELPRAATLDADSRQRLQAIGYLSGHPGNGTRTGRPDPKDRRELAARIAQVTAGELQGAALIAALKAIVQDDARNGQAHMRLGYALADAGRCGEAEPSFRAAIAAGVPSADPYLGLAVCLGQRGEARDAERVLQDALRVEPGNPVVEANLGIAALGADRVEAAIGHLQTALRIAPDLLQARFELARALATAGRRDEAAAQARDLLGRLPAGAPQRAEVERLLRAVQ